MKRYRHYNKGTAIILSCFGSVIEQDRYFSFEEYIKKAFKNIDIFTAFSSKMVIKELEKEGQTYKNLPQVMADVDMLGYKRYIVVSVNIFPTDEHEVLVRIVKGFKNFSLANIRYTNPLLHKTKETSLYLKHLDETIRNSEEHIINLYVIHGVPVLNLGGLESVSYTADFLKMIDENNLTCSLEGEFPFYAVKDAIKKEILKRTKERPDTKVQVVPMLLVSGNHYFKDMIEICEEIGEYCNSSIVSPLDGSKKFNLLGQDEVREIFKSNIEVEIKKLGLL
ncbi:MAG: sirohydrochlorin cobaltochelatase [Sulfurimonas sp.]|nr:sirohydrochlorin cobaltochelatase [Sulfurimonas sp.]